MTQIKDTLSVQGDVDCNHLLPRAPIQLQRGSHLLSGRGVPNNTLGFNGDLYVRADPTGAGATHLYYRNAGAWIGIA
jgi:hypothetical protein